MSFDGVREVDPPKQREDRDLILVQGELLASAGDDGNVIMWAPSESHSNGASFGDGPPEDKETWIFKRMCRSTSGSEIYDLAWSPDGLFFVTGSMDNVARIFDAQTGKE